jgi:glycosyltransferase involved in cell wall biosynthesis
MSADSTMQPRARCLMTYPWPLDHPIGSRVVLLSYARAFRNMGIGVDCFAPRRGPIARDELGYLSVFDRIFGPLAPREEAARRLADADDLLADTNLPDPYGRDTTSMMAASVVASSGDYELVGVHYTRCHSIARALPPRPRRILFTHELDAEVLRQEAALGGSAAAYTIADEVARMEAFDLITAVGPHDLAHIRAAAPERSVVEAPFCPDVVRPRIPKAAGDFTLLFASSNARFHQSSFQWFWSHVWPRVREEARLLVAGSISDFARQLGASLDPRAQVLGIVPTLDALYDASDLAVAPYCYGGGIKTKIVETLAHGLPVVTTSAGLTNTRLTPGVDVLVADAADEFAATIQRVKASPQLGRSLSRAAASYIAREHDPATAYAGLQQQVEELLRQQAGETQPKTTGGPNLAVLERIVPSIVRQCRAAAIRRVAVFGAGSHTSSLLPLWTAAGGVDVAAILVSTKGTIKTFDSLPVVAVDDFDSRTVDGIVLSSHTYEDDMARTCESRWPGLPIFTFWRQAVRAGLASRAVPESERVVCGPVIPAAIRDISLGDQPGAATFGRVA